MTKDEALKLALWHEAMAREPNRNQAKREKHEATAKFIKEALAQPEQDSTYTYASSLATTIWQKHYIKESPKFALLDTTEGVLTQIDNMTCGLVREKPAQPDQEPVAWADHGVVNWIADKQFQHEADLYTTPPQREFVGLTDEERQDIALEVPIDAVFITEAKLKYKNTRG